MITATMTISGGHLNPAVTIGLLSTRRIDLKSAGVYVAAQLVGAVLAALLLQLLLPAGFTRMLATSATPALADGMT